MTQYEDTDADIVPEEAHHPDDEGEVPAPSLERSRSSEGRRLLVNAGIRFMLAERDAHVMTEEEEMKVDHKVLPPQQVTHTHTHTSHWLRGSPVDSSGRHGRGAGP